MSAAVASAYPKAALTDAEGRRARSAMRPAVQREQQSANRRCSAGVMGSKGRGKLVDPVAVRELLVHFVGSCMRALEGLTAAHLIRACGEVRLQIEMNLVKAPVHNKSFPEITVLVAFFHVTHMIISNNSHIVIKQKKKTAGKRRGELTSTS